MAPRLPITQQFTRTVLSHIHEYISGQGYFYTKQDIANFFLSLRTKPFVILAGISGTGKTQLVRQFAAALGCKDTCTLIPVKPDWTDNTDLLGYTDLNGHFRQQALLDIMLQARQSPGIMYFVILDEMNLARVEYYFSDFLSLIETRERQGKRIITDPILTTTQLGKASEYNPNLVNLSIPDNLYVIGTVNMDETTHPFSRKVLDRANTIEMNQVHLEWPPDTDEIEPLADVFNDFLRTPYLHPRDISPKDQKKLTKTLALLTHLNQILKGADLQFGYRIRDEIAFYMLNRYQIRELITENEAHDYQMMQKILPRIQGSSRRIGEVLCELISFLTPASIVIKPNMYAREIIEAIGNPRRKGIKYPRSLEKLLIIYRRFEEDGFTSYWM